MNVEKYKVFELELDGPASGNPFKDVELSAVFSNGTWRLESKGFYKGGGKYAVRFMPQEEGEWHYTVHSTVGSQDGASGTFTCTAPSAGNHGRVCLKRDVRAKSSASGAEDNFHFCYEDGTRFQPFGTTCYAWINQPEAVQEKTLKTLASSPFNKIRMCIFPKHYTYNTTNPDMYPFPGDSKSGFDFTQFNTDFFSHLEKRIKQLDDLGIEADIILFHPYDRWGFSKMTKEQDIFYLTYVVRRLSHFKNVWWSLANEYDLLPWKPAEGWDTYARVIIENDPYGHMRSIHNCIALYDHTKPWITHVSVQRVDLYRTAEEVTTWRNAYGKPVIVDEVGYEGNIDYGWGSLTGEEETRRFWEGCIRGGYMTHGETFVDKGDQIWWSHGGVLHGESPARIAFLKSVMADVPESAEPLKMTAENHEENWDSICMHDGDDFFLYYYGFERPLWRNYTLPAGKKYEIELLDAWNMTVEKLEGTFEGKIRIKMGAKQYMAVRMRAVK